MTEEEKKAKEAEEEAKRKAEEEAETDLELDDIDDEEEDEEAKKKAEEEAKHKAEMEERARQAQARREREARERAEKEKRMQEDAFQKGELSALKENPYTKEAIKDEYDLKVYKLQKSIEERGGDPITDLPKEMAKLERDVGTKTKEQESEKKSKEEAIRNDIKDFQTKFPKLNLTEILNDPDFSKYYDGRLGVKGGKSLAELYTDFNDMKSRLTKNEPPKSNEEEENGKVSPPSPNGGRKQQQTSYSKMSEDEKIKELKKQGLI